MAPAIYLALNAFVSLTLPSQISWPHRLIFFLYALFVGWILLDLLTGKKKPEENSASSSSSSRTWLMLLGLAVLLVIASRLFMFIKFHSTPLGYDTGFYWQYFDLITRNGTSAKFITTGNLVYVPWFPLFFLGLKAVGTIHLLHVFHQLLLLGALYLLINALVPKKTEALAATALVFIIFALSVNQFLAYWWMFYKVSAALPFLLAATALFIRRSPLALPLAALGAAIHLPTALPFGFGLFIFVVWQIGRSLIMKEPLDKKLVYSTILSGVAALILIIILKGRTDVESMIIFFKKYQGLVSRAPSWEITQASGNFLPSSITILNALPYVPFGLIGLLSPLWKRGQKSDAAQLLPAIALGAGILSFSPFLYQNRYLIVLDISLIILAAPIVAIFIQRVVRAHYGKSIIALFSLGALISNLLIIGHQQPQIYKNEIEELKAIRRFAYPKDYAMATSGWYTPWVFAYFNFTHTIAPGWLTWDKWSMSMWQEFWTGKNQQRRLELLELYGNHDIYVFFGARQILHESLKEFLETDPHLKKISAHVWRYSPNIPRPSVPKL